MSPQDERFLLAAGGASSVFPSKTEDRDNIRVGLELADAAYKWGDEARAQAISETCSAAKVRSFPQTHLSLSPSHPHSLSFFLRARVDLDMADAEFESAQQCLKVSTWPTALRLSSKR